MFKIKVLSSFLLKNLNIVMVEGKVLSDGKLKENEIIMEEKNPENEYIFLGVGMIKSDVTKVDIQLKMGDYNPQDLVGKILVNKI